jgi:alginate O-acetyltransferase complex protein AlgF
MNALKCKRLTLLALGATMLVAQTLVVHAQPAGQLYDPEPPADSAYVRILVVNHASPVDLLIDGKVRSNKLSPGEVSDYLVLTGGKHSIALNPSGKTSALTSYTLDVVPGKAMTLAFASLKADSKPSIFEDKTNTNKLKSLVTAYHLDSKSGALNLQTVDGSTKVFNNLVFGASNSIQVNPISVELVAAKAGETQAAAGLSKTKLSMAASANYSVFLMPNEQGLLTAKAVQNKTERYSGK